MTRLRVEVVSDVVCPWCWVGKRELEAAAARQKVELELVYRPFMLDPDLPDLGVDKMQYFIRKFGPQAVGMIKDPNNPLNVRGQPLGIQFNYTEGCKVFNSRKAHKLLTWAEALPTPPGAQAKLKEVMMRKYFQENLNLGLDAELLKAVEEVQLPVDVAKQVLDGTIANNAKLEETLDARLAESHSKVSGLPAFYFPGGIEVNGGQTGAVFERIIQRALAHAS